jgi:four helix bundle protein
MPSRFRSLSAYRLAVQLADDLHRLVARWPPFDRETVGLQLIRAVDSVGANIAEAAGRWTAADKRRHLIIARGSLYETEHWLDRAQARGLVSDDRSGQVAEVARALNGMIKQPAPR